MKVVVAAGGMGTRFAPVTKFINKQLVPIGNNELMIDMPLKFLQRNGFKRVCIITGTHHASQMCEYVGDGGQYGFKRVNYFVQPKPLGVADLLNRIDFENEGVLLILGDNYFESNDLSQVIFGDKAIAWEYDVDSIERARAFGQFFNGSIVEKPKDSNRTHILTGLYYFPKDVLEKLNKLTPSARNELEITHLLDMYLKEGRLDVEQVTGKWFDLGEQPTWAEFIIWRNVGL